MTSRVGLGPELLRQAAFGQATKSVAAHFMRFCGVVALCLTIVGWGSPASALVVNPGDSVEVNFFFATPPDVGGDTIDFLGLTTTPFTASGPNIEVNAQLFNGSTLLGSGTRPSAALISFSDGLYANAISASLGSVTDPGFAGRILFTPIFPGGSGFIEFTLANFNVRAGHGRTEEGLILASDGAIITSVSIPTVETPVPAAMLLFFSALMALGGLVVRRKRGAEAAIT